MRLAGDLCGSLATVKLSLLEKLVSFIAELMCTWPGSESTEGRDPAGHGRAAHLAVASHGPVDKQQRHLLPCRGSLRGK